MDEQASTQDMMVAGDSGSINQLSEIVSSYRHQFDVKLQLAVNEAVKDDVFGPTAEPGQSTSGQRRWVWTEWGSESVVHPLQIRGPFFFM
ncbi:hypothetical protein KIN20_003633 [Parelaphostrongylus tenuis]|uniref:Uncharacterized protein n=1 Tax=Parelaphostrongylus tenuis TaxID=148309 RepID=A0AAD5LX42_PARTN|nr:hypothetical protein KIN20_003633 [Parelaphostrongylus tenuis]